jgi:hypothetical protein
MAAIDKIYAKEYWQYRDLLVWSIIYYPKLLRYFYDINLTYQEFAEKREWYVENVRENNNKGLEMIGGRGTTYQEAIDNLQSYYKKEADYDCPYDQAKEEVHQIKQIAWKSDKEIELMYSYPITNTPCHVDNYLKWHCPIKFVREYLHNQCGVNPKWEWVYRLFWKGKKMFS